jgi:polyhydroxyalkanoate synthase
MSIAAADMAKKGDDRLKTLTLLAAQTDFTEAGEIKLFINESNVAFLEDMMKEHGVLEGGQMAGAFKLLRANALIWQRLQQDYLLGTRSSANDMMAWNADTTRMPYKMHSEYLRSLYLENQLSSEKFEVDGRTISLRDLTLPIFAVGTETDHVAPWQSVYKIHQFSHAPVQFILTKGGHNAGIVSEPGHPRRHYHTHHSKISDPALTPEDWLEVANYKEGSWWPEWARWLARKSSKKQAQPPMGKALAEAPGTYIYME